MPLLLCDLDDSLVDRVAAFDIWARQLSEVHGEGEELRTWLITEDGQGHRPRGAFFDAVRARLSLSESAAELKHRFHEQLVANLCPDASVLESLHELKARGWKVAVVTNSPNAALQMGKIEAVGASGLVDAVCFAGIDGPAKPDPQLFRLATRRCGCSLELAWMIGDHPDDDIGGAEALGVSSVWMNLGRRWPRGDLFPTLEAASFAEAVRAVLEFGAPPEALCGR